MKYRRMHKGGREIKLRIKNFKLKIRAGTQRRQKERRKRDCHSADKPQNPGSWVFCLHENSFARLKGFPWFSV
jgi:hypothetical protein